MLRRNIYEPVAAVAWRLQGGVVDLFLARLSGGAWVAVVWVVGECNPVSASSEN
jgi:hypothetical protein